MASYLDTINKLYDLERKRINPYSAAQEVGAQQLSVVPQLQTSVETQAAVGNNEEKNKGGVFGGVGYVGEKLAAGLMQSIEGIWDFAAGGIADLLGADDWAEDQVANDWFGDWYETAGDWFNAGDGWKVAGDVASGIGTSVLPMAAMFIPVPGVNFAVSFAAASMAAGGTALKEAYAKTGKLGTEEWSYAAMSGGTEGGLEIATNLVGLGGGTLLKQFGKTAAKNMAKQATKAAAKQGVKATLSTVGKTAFEGFIGEAFEEGMSAILNPIYARASYDPEAKNATAQEIAYSALVGGLSGIVMGEGGLIASSVRSTQLGGKLVNQSEAILAEAEAIIKDETAEPSGSDTVKLINAKKAQLEKSLQQNNGVYGTTQKKLLGDLNLAVTEHVATKAAQASAINIINNAEAIAQELNTLGYKDVNGNPMNVTADMIREGVSGKNKRNALRNALKNNPLLRSLAAADAAGRLLMDTESFAEQARSGKTFRSQDLLDQFIERASDEQKASLAHDLGIQSWDGLRVEEFNYLVENQPDTVGKQFKRARQKQQFEKLRNNKSFTIGKASAYRANKDGIRKYKVNGHTFAVEKNGDEYTLYDYDNKGVSIELSLDQLRKSLAIYDEAQEKLKQSAEKTADASEQGAEQNNAPTGEKSSENAQKEKTATEKDTGKGENLVQKSFKIAKKVAGYDKLSAPDQRRVRSFIRQGLAFGVKEDVIVAGASISSRTRVEAIFNKAACAIIDENGNFKGYANGFYNPRTKQFVFNPEAQSTDGILIHELDHALRKRVGKGGFVTTKIYKGAIDKLDPDTFQKITKKYDEKYEQRSKVPEKATYLKRNAVQQLEDKLVEQKKQEELAKNMEVLVDEYEAHYAQQVLENKGIMEHLVAEKPALKQRILDFFKGAEVDYAKVPALSKEAAKYYKRYKRWFDSFAKSREGARIGAEAEMGVRGGESDVRYSFSSIAYKFFGADNMETDTFSKMDYKKTEGYKSYVEESLSNLRQTMQNFDEKTARASVEESIDGIVRVAVAAKQAGYDIKDTGKKRSTKDSKNRLLFSSLEPNSDYITSHDISTICDKRKTFAEIYDDIVRKEEALGVPNEKRFFSNISNYFIIHDIMARKGLTAPCRQCYVESMRKNLARMANAFVKLISETDTNNKQNDQLWNTSGKSKGQPKVGNTALRNDVLEYLSENGLTPEYFTVEKLTTASKLSEMRLEHPRLYEAFNSFYGQSKPKMPKEAVPFRFGELTALLTGNNGKIRKEMVKRINSTGCFRLQSYSDFQIENFVDVLQVIFEAGTLGLNGHAYTKVPAFLDATDGTNLKRNISVFMYKDGKEWRIDKADSFPGTMEDIYARVETDTSGNTGIIVVVQNDSNAAWVMANDRVGYGIPFHKSGNAMGTVRGTVVHEDGREIHGYKDIKDHTKFQSETWKETTEDHKAGTKVKSGISIYDFWDFDNKENLSKKALIKKNLVRYIDECDKLGYRPKFVDYLKGGSILNETLAYAKEMGFVDENATVASISFHYKGYVVPYGYYKFLGDFGMFTPDGKASPQKPLSLEHYDFDKAVSFFENAESLRREEILQRFENGKVRDELRASNKTTAELADLLNESKSEIVSEVMRKRYGKSADVVLSLPLSDSEGVELSAEQQEFFKDSKVRDSEGKLTPVYHGTPNGGFTEFQLPFYLHSLTSAQGAGFYFTDKANASQYMKGLNGKSVSKKQLYKVYLNITNPLEISEYSKGAISDEVFRRIMARGNYEWGMAHTDIDKLLRYDTTDSDRLADMVKVFNGEEILTVLKEELGYDGVRYTDRYGDIWVAWDKSQIKNTTNKAPTTNPDIRMSLPITDADGNTIEYSEEDLEYERVVQEAMMHGDMSEVQDMVDEKARRSGFTVRAYHGTKAFGFTQVDLAKSDDGISFFATDSITTAGTYSVDKNVKRIKDAREYISDEKIEEMREEAFDAAADIADWCNRTLGIRGWTDEDSVHKKLESVLDSAEHDSITSDEISDKVNEIFDDLWFEFEERYYDDQYDGNFAMSDEDWMDFEEWQDSEEAEKMADKFYDPVSKIHSIANALLNAEGGLGIYDLYLNTDGHLIIEGHGVRWDRIIYAENLPDVGSPEFEKYGYSGHRYAWTTRSIAAYAKDNGYSGVTFNDIVDTMDGSGDVANVYISFYPISQVKSADPVTYDDNGFIIPLSKRFDPTVSDIRYSLRDVDPVQPTSDKWSRTRTTNEAKAIYPKLWDVSADESETRNPTQIAQTVNTYRKIFDYLKEEGFDGTILDASSGLGYGTKAGIEEYGFNIEDVEPYPDENYKPKYTDYSKINKKYDVIISSFVLNVLPQDQRDALVVRMGELLKDGGRIFVNVRSKDVDSLAKTGKNIHLGDMEWIETARGSYQKGFKKSELVAYLQDALGDEYDVIPTSLQSSVAAIVTKKRDGKLTGSKNAKSGDISYSLPLDDSYVDNGVPYVGGNEMSVGEMRKRIANSTHYKVYSKSRMLETVKNLPGASFLKGKTLETLADSMWTSFNAITSTEQADAYVSDMADYIMSVAMREAKTGRTPSEDAQRRVTMMRGYVQKLVFSKEQLHEIKTVLGEKEYKRILGRWGYKAKAGETSHRVPMDFFVTDIAREMSEFSYLEDMHPIDAFIALDEAYTEAKKDVDDKWQSIFEDASDAELEAMRYALKTELWNAYKTAGDKSNYKKLLENTVESYKERADYWKAEYDKENGRNRLHNIVAAKARKLRDLKTHRFENATQFENDTLDAVIAKLARVVVNGNLSVKTAKSACGELLMLYRSSTFREGVLEFYDENNKGYYNELIETYLEILVGEENHLSIEDYVDKGDQYYNGYTKQQLKMLADVMSYFTSLYENYGKVWKKGKLVEAMPLAEQYIDGIRETKAIYGGKIGNRLTNWYRDNFFDPMSVMRRIDGYADGFHTEIFGEFRRGIIDASVAIMDIFREYDGWLNSHKKYLANASETSVEFMGHEIPKIKLIDLYCTTKRKQAQAGLAINGFAYDDLKGLVVRVDGKLDKDGKYTEEQIQEVITGMQTEIEKHLTAEDREYIALIEKVYNGEAKRLKTMRDFARQGFTNAEADYYYPIRRAYIAKSVDSSTMKEEIDRVSNASFNKDVVKGAKQELTVESADSRFRRHVQAVCQYAYLSPAVDTFNRLYNLDTAGNKGRPVSIRTESENLWRNGMAYFKKLVADIQGINERTEGSEVLSFLRGGYAISVLSLNPKVWVTQLSSFAAASGMLDMDCITSGLTTATKEDIKNIGRYCPLAELRHYENTAAMAQAVIDPRGAQRNKGGKVMQAVRKAGEAGMAPIEKMDSLVINRLFGACMKQVSKNQGLKVGTEENKIAAGKLLETLILETQQNALATERSAAMRSNNEIFRAATMFSADAMKVVCRFVDATGEARALKARIKNATDPDVKASLEAKLKQANKKVRKTLGALLASSAYMAAVTALFKTLYNKWDREWEEDEEKAHSVGTSILFDFLGNNFGGLPLIRDVVSKLTEGYDIDNYAYSAINDIVNAAQKIATLANGDATDADVANALRDLAYATSNLTGLPVRNVYNVLYGLTKRVSEPAAYKIDEMFYNKNYASDLNKYLDEGDTQMVDFMVDLIYGTRTDTTLKESTMEELRQLANKDYKVLPREVKSAITIDGNEYKLSATEQEKVRVKYTEYLSALDRLTESASYSNLETEQKYTAVKYVIDTYYNKAVSDVIGNDCGKATLLSACIGGEKMAVLKARVKDYENDTDKKGEEISGTKRKKIVKAINAMSATTTQKILMMYALGYTPKDKEIAGVSASAAKKQLLNSIVNAKSLTKAQKESLAKACGFTVKNGKIIP